MSTASAGQSKLPETSGRVYHSQNGMPAHELIHVGPGELYRFRSHERYVSDDGVHLTIDWAAPG